MEIYLNSIGQECVLWENENGETHSMLKSAYDEQQVALKDAAK